MAFRVLKGQRPTAIQTPNRKKIKKMPVRPAQLLAIVITQKTTDQDFY